MFVEFPIGEERARTSSLNPLESLRIRINLEDNDPRIVDHILFTIWGEDGQRFSNRIEFEQEVDVAMDIDCYSTAMAIGATIYTVSLVLKDETERLVAKGKVVL